VSDDLTAARELLAKYDQTLEAINVAAEANPSGAIDAQEQAAQRAFDVAERQLETCAPGLVRTLLAALTAERQAREQAEQEQDRLRKALEELRINANRLCDRQLGGTYEDDCRRSLAKAEAALAPQDTQP
jgi:hypothetical protein